MRSEDCVKFLEEASAQFSQKGDVGSVSLAQKFEICANMIKHLENYYAYHKYGVVKYSEAWKGPDPQKGCQQMLVEGRVVTF